MSALFVMALLAPGTIPAARAQQILQAVAPRIEVFELNHALTAPAPTATFQSARVVHRVKHNNKWWMRILVTFRVKNALSTPCRLIAYFYDEDEEPLEAGDDRNYRTTSGYVSVWKDFTPSYNDAAYNEFELYLPYSALNLDTDPGNAYDLKFYLAASDEYNKRIFAKSGWYEFSVKW
jgi:hypothetical protein